MGFMLILLAIAVLCLVTSFIILHNVDYSYEFLHGCTFAGIAIGAILGSISVLFFIFAGVDKLAAPVNMQELSTLRGKYIRLLNEDYNSLNLNNALDFNEKQKNCQFKESGLMWSHFQTNGVCIDTIEIPTSKFIPRQILQIEADSTK